jgi:hypothetical protein
MKSLVPGLLVATLSVACSSDPGPFVPYVPEPGSPESVAYDNGLTRYLGNTPVTSTYPGNAGTTIHEFDIADGPQCMRGREFRAITRRKESRDLMIFLQGGGACWSDFCFAITTAPPDMPETDLLKADDTNPFWSSDLLYVPYCDGSLFVGDAAIDENADGTPDRIHHGLANLSAALTAGYDDFPDPSRIVLVGSSGGGFGTILAVFLVRYVYRDVPIVVINDAGVGVAHPEDPSFVDDLLVEFGARTAVPADCTDCIADGNVTRLIRYALDRDPKVRIAALTSEYDFVISDVFLKVAPDVFRQNVITATDEIRAAHPDRYRRFLFAGDAHTATLGALSAFVGVDVAEEHKNLAAQPRRRHAPLRNPPDVIGAADAANLEAEPVRGRSIVAGVEVEGERTRPGARAVAAPHLAREVGDGARRNGIVGERGIAHVLRGPVDIARVRRLKIDREHG